MGNARELPCNCLYLFVPAKRNTLDGHGDSVLHGPRMGCGIDGVATQRNKLHSPTMKINIEAKEEDGRRNP